MVDSAGYLGVEEEVAKKELQKVMEFEMRLANISSPKEERRDNTKLYNPTTLGEFTRQVMKSSLGDLVSDLALPKSWTDYAQKLFTFDNEKIEITESEKVIIKDQKFFQKLNSVLENTNDRTLANYMGWRMVKYSMAYLCSGARAIKHEYNKVLTGADKEKPAWKRCTQKTGFNNQRAKKQRDSSTFTFAVSSMFARHIFDSEAKAQVVDMIKYLRKAFNSMLEEIKWMDADTKIKAFDKLEKMKQIIAYPDEFLDRKKVDGIHDGLEIDVDDYLGNVLRLSKHFGLINVRKLREPVDPYDWREHRYVAIVNAFWNPVLNLFKLPAGIIQGGLFHPKVPKYLNFGGIGNVIGHEITHGFDDKGRQIDANGKLDLCSRIYIYILFKPK